MKDQKIVGRLPLMDLAGASIMTVKFCMANIPGRFSLVKDLPDKAQSDWSGKPDTGRQVLENERLVAGEGLFDETKKLGLKFRAALKAPWKQGGVAVSVVFARPEFALAGNPTRPTGAAEKLVREMLAETWQYAHAWEHKSTALGSIVLIAPIFGGKPFHGLRLEDRSILTLTTFDSLALKRVRSSGSEAARIGRELLAHQHSR